MYDFNGPLRLHRQTTRLERLSSNASAAWTKLQATPHFVKVMIALTLLVLVAVLSGCAMHSPPDTLPKNPSPPQLSEPIPQKSYSSKAQELIESWLQRVTGM